MSLVEVLKDNLSGKYPTYWNIGEFVIFNQRFLESQRNWFLKKDLINFAQDFGVCYDADIYFDQTLTPSNNYYRRGFVLKHKDKYLGFIKLKGNKTFLAWDNYKFEENGLELNFEFGGIYQTPLLGKLPQNNQNKNWQVLTVNSLGFCPLRDVRELRENLFRLTSIREKLRNERDIFLESLDC